MRRAVYAFILIIILAFLGGFPAYLALGQGGSQTVTITVTAQPVYSPPTGGGGGGGGAAGCPAGEMSTTGRVTAKGIATQPFMVKSFDERFRLIINKGIIALTRHGTCPRCIGIHEMTQPPSPPEGAYIIGVMYDVVPDGATFTPPAVLEYSYDPSDIPAGVTEQSLVIAYYDGATGKWMELDSIVDTEANAITAKISRFNDLAVFGYRVEAPAPPAFECSWLSISPTEVDIGETVNITILVANTGGQSGNYQVILKINGVVAEEKNIVLDVGASEQVSFSTSRDTAGIYSVEVNGLTGAFVVKENPTPVEPTPVKPINWWLIGGIIAAAGIVALVIFLLRRRMIF